MTKQELLDRFATLPEEAQRQVEDFITFLIQKYQLPKQGTKTGTELTHENFVGMWSDQKELEDSTAWVRNIRTKEWADSNG